MWLGDEVLMLDRDDRDVEADHGAGGAREVAAAGDNMLAFDVALVGGDAPAMLADATATAQWFDFGDAGVAVNLRA